MRPLQFILVAIARIGIGDAFVVLRLQLQIQEFTLLCDKFVDGDGVGIVLVDHFDMNRSSISLPYVQL